MFQKMKKAIKIERVQSLQKRVVTTVLGAGSERLEKLRVFIF